LVTPQTTPKQDATTPAASPSAPPKPRPKEPKAPPEIIESQRTSDYVIYFELQKCNESKTISNSIHSLSVGRNPFDSVRNSVWGSTGMENYDIA